MPAVLAELRAGQKRTHWMWFVFPQLRGLGRSATAQFYGLRSLAEAQAYAAHPVLGPRLRECVALAGHSGRDVRAIFGTPDDLKLHSCLTLFARADPDPSVFASALSRHFGGQEDAATVALLRSPSP